MPDRNPALFLPPMLAVTAGEPFDRDDWWYEWKWDGYRAIVSRTDRLRIYSRRGTDLLARFPDLGHIADDLCAPVVLDGEVVAFDANRGLSFAGLAARASASRAFIAFDCLYSDGRWHLSEPLSQRLGHLAAAVQGSGRLQRSPGWAGRGHDLLSLAKARGLEGVMAKRLASSYHPGRRVHDWMKFLLYQTEDFAVGRARPDGHGGWRWEVLDRDRRVCADMSAPKGWEPPAYGTRDWVTLAPAIRVVVAFRERTPTGRLRHPVLKTWEVG